MQQVLLSPSGRITSDLNGSGHFLQPAGFTFFMIEKKKFVSGIKRVRAAAALQLKSSGSAPAGLLLHHKLNSLSFSKPLRGSEHR